MLVFAQATEGVDGFVSKVMDKFLDVVVNPIIYIGFTVCFILFFVGIIEFLAQGNSAEKALKGKNHMFWGIIGLFIFIASIWLVQTLSGIVSGPQVFQA